MEEFLFNKVKLLLDSSSNDSSSDESEEDIDILLTLLQRSSRSHAHDKHSSKLFVDAQKYCDSDFQVHFKMSRSSFQQILENLKTDAAITPGRPSVPIKESLLLTIWTLTTTEGLRSIGSRFGFSAGHAHNLFINVCTKMYAIHDKYIIWPKGIDATRTVNEFNNLRGANSFPNVLGCVNGTHIAIPGPLHDNSYNNSKGFHSILLQGICNAKQEFFNIYCGWPGSVSNAHMWSYSGVCKKLTEDPSTLLPPNTYLLGDSAYPLNTFLMVPFGDNGQLSRKQKSFNTKLNSTRVVIDQAFRRLKGQFRRLHFLHILNLEYFKFIVTSACILHNISIKDGILFEDIGEPDEDENGEEDYHLLSCSNGSALRKKLLNQIIT